MYKPLFTFALVITLFSCVKTEPLETNDPIQPRENDVLTLRIAEGLSYHTCPLENGRNGHICRYPGKNCRNTGRRCLDVDKNGKPNGEVSFYTIVSSSLDTPEEFDMFWNFTYDGAFVTTHYDMFLDLHEHFDGIHPDEQLEYFESL